MLSLCHLTACASLSLSRWEQQQEWSISSLPGSPAHLPRLIALPSLLSQPCYPAPCLGSCHSGQISQEAAPPSGVPRSIAWIPWCISSLPHVNCSGIVTELACHTECLFRPGQLYRPLSPGPWPECRVWTKSQREKPHIVYSLIEPPAAHITRIYVSCAWGFAPEFWYWSETVRKFSEKCWYQNSVWSAGRVINQCGYSILPPS